MLIERLSDIERINALEREFQMSTGLELFNVSSWHISEHYRKKFLERFSPPLEGNAVDYIYTYSLKEELRNRVLEKLGVATPASTLLLVLPNNTIAIVNAVNLLKLHGYKKVCIVNPAYFSVAQTFRSMDIPYGVVSMIRQDGEYIFPLDDILRGGYDVVWITSPVYSTGVYLQPHELEKLKFLLDQGVFVVADESFALHGHELVRQFGVPENFLSICSPHKSISCNGFKFSGIIASAEYEDFLEQWVDVLGGNLPQSTYVAVYHYLSNNYDDCLKLFYDEMDSSRRTIAPMLKGAHHAADRGATGSLLTVYYDNIPFEETKTDAFFNQLYKKTCASLYPGWLNGFDQSFGLCFRINLALDESAFRQALQRLTQYLDAL